MRSFMKSASNTLTILRLVLIFHGILLVGCTTVDLDWVSHNPLFLASGLRILRRDVRINDRIRFTCSNDGSEHVAIHRVSEHEAFSCERLSKFTDALVGTCTKANDSVIIRLRQLPMLPNELSYKPNNDYYFISTSTGTPEGLENAQGGLCVSHKMRVQIHVRPKQESSSNSGQSGGESDSMSGQERIMVLPIDSRQYPVPVMYVPVSAANENLRDDGDRRHLQMPHHFYVPSSHLQQSLLTNARIIDQRDEQPGDYPYRPRVIVHHSNPLIRDRTRGGHLNDRFDAQDEPSRSIELSGLRTYPRNHRVDQFAKATALKGGTDRDFEVEYVDLPSRGSTLTYGLFMVISCFLIIFVYLQ